jgi:hypothetical protein
MPDLVSSSDRLVSRPLALVAAAVAGMALAATVAMWVRYGGAVFYEMIAAGFAACF